LLPCLNSTMHITPFTRRTRRWKAGPTVSVSCQWVVLASNCTIFVTGVGQTSAMWSKWFLLENATDQCISIIFCRRVLEATCAAYASLSLSLLDYITVDRHCNKKLAHRLFDFDVIPKMLSAQPIMTVNNKFRRSHFVDNSWQPAVWLQQLCSDASIWTITRGYAYAKIQYISVCTYHSKNRIHVWYVSYANLNSPNNVTCGIVAKF